MIAAGISRCLFEESDPEGDEVVLMKLLELSALCLRCEVGTLLDEERIWQIFETCLRVSSQERESGKFSLLGSTADNTLAHIVLVVFSRARDTPSAVNAADIVLPVALPATGSDHETTAAAAVASSNSGSNNAVSASVAGESGPLAVVRIMHFLSLLCNPRTNSEQACVLSLGLINIALEAGGEHLGTSPALVAIMQGDLCKHLLQNSQSEDLTILGLTLRVVFNLFNSIKDHLKVQLEVFLTSVHLRLLEGVANDTVRLEQRELVLESLLE